MTQRSIRIELPVGRRQQLAELAERLGVTRLLAPLHDRGRRSLIVLAYHRILPVEDSELTTLDLDLISATPAEFEWQMQYIRRHMHPVSLGAVVDFLAGRSSLPPRAVAVTFDDGFNDTYRYAYPVLRRHRIPATVFVTTGYVESGEPFWFVLAANLMMRVAPGAIEVEGCLRPFPFGSSLEERRNSLRQLQEVLKAMPNSRRTSLIAGWIRQFPQYADMTDADLSRPISWPQVTEMAAGGIDFGSHTVTHPVLTLLRDEDLQWELAESKRILEQRLDREVTTLAYPVGTPQSFDDRVMECASRMGFQLAVSYVQGVNWLQALRRFELRRHGVGLHTSRAHFRAMMNLPDWIS